MQCPECGVEVVEGAVFCHRCGASLLPGNPGPAPESDPDAEAPSPRERFEGAGRRGDDDSEQELWAGTYCGKAMISAWALSGAITVVLLVVAVVFWSSWYVGIIALALIPCLWLYQYLVMVFRKMDVRYRLTTHRFFHESGILRRKQDLIEVIDIDDITCDQSLLERLVGVGSIHISSSDKTHPELTIYGIEDCKSVSEIMERARHDERRRRGLHIEHI